MRSPKDMNTSRLDMAPFDFMKVSLDYNYRTIVGADRKQAGDSIRVLSAASSHGRWDASVFLMGLLHYVPADDWEMKIQIAKALEHTPTRECADLLFAEIRKVGSSNKTRTYLTTVIDVLASFPNEIKEPGFRALATDKSFTPKMRRKFAVLASDEEEDSLSLRMFFDEDPLDV